RAEIERLTAALEKGAAQRVELEKEVALAQARARDAIRRAAGLQYSLDLAISRRANELLALPKSADVPPAEMATIYCAIRHQLLEDWPLNRSELSELPGLAELPHQTISDGLSALFDANLIRASESGDLSLPPPNRPNTK